MKERKQDLGIRSSDRVRAQANEQTEFTFIVPISLPDITQGQTANRQLQWASKLLVNYLLNN